MDGPPHAPEQQAPQHDDARYRPAWAPRDRTTVINVSGRDRATLLADPDFVYVGHVARRGGWPGSLWANPYTADSSGGASEAVRLFEQDIRGHSNRAIFLRSRLGELRGKVLGCWCCDWDGRGEPRKPCHAVILARLADELTDLDVPPRR